MSNLYLKTLGNHYISQCVVAMFVLPVFDWISLRVSSNPTPCTNIKY